MNLRLLLATLLFAALLASAPAQSPSPAPAAAAAPKIEFDEFILVLLLRPPNAPELPEAELKQLQAGHMANMERLHAEGKLFKAGPTKDHSGRNVRGIFIFKSESVENVREWVATDPLIKRGRLVAEYMTWFVEKGNLK